MGPLPMYEKSHFVDDVISEDTCIDLIEEFNRRTWGSVFMTHETLGGAVSEAGNQETAFAHRNSKFLAQSSI